MYLAFDTETSGLLDFKRPLMAPEQPRMVQLGATLWSPDGVERAVFRALIRSDEWSITAGAQATHGISKADCDRFGIPVVEALAVLMRLVENATHLVAHSLKFDDSMIRRELALAKASTPVWERPRLKRCCTMLLASPLNDGRWPKLAWLHQHLFDAPAPGGHDGLEDARAAMRCYLELRKRGLATDAEPSAQDETTRG